MKILCAARDTKPVIFSLNITILRIALNINNMKNMKDSIIN